MIALRWIAPESAPWSGKLRSASWATSRPGHYLVLLAAGLILLLYNLGAPSLWDLDEGKNATAALEMLESSDFIVPTFNAQLRVDKPVFLYWLQAASIKAFGANEFAARFPSAVAALLTLFCCYELGRTVFQPSTGLLAGLILSSSAMMVGAGRFANPDALLNVCIAATLTTFWRSWSNPSPGALSRRPSSRSWLVIGTLLGLGALAKGPVGIVLPALVVITFLAWENRLSDLWDPRIGYAALSLALVALPWYIWVTVLTRGRFLLGFLWEHNFSRFLTPINNHAGSPFYYFVVLLVGTAPWSIIMFFGHWYGAWSTVRNPWPLLDAWWREIAEGASTVQCKAPQTAAVHSERDSASGYRFLAVWLISYFVFFSVAATKLPNYLLPAAVPCALLTARFVDRWRLGEISPPRWVLLGCLASMAAVGVLTGLGLVLVSGRIAAVTFARPFVHGLEYWGLVGLVPVAAALMGFGCLRRGRTNGVVWSLVAGIILFMGPLIAWALPAWNGIKAPHPLVEQALALRPDALGRERDIRIGGFQLEHLPSLNFYARREVMHQGNEAEALAFLRYPMPVYLFLPAQIWQGLKEAAPAGCRLIGHHPDLYRRDDIVLVTNDMASKEHTPDGSFP
jgi:4-amino-4-deoxy-L-arabinose transferase-like glycosyltransferase